MELKSFGTRKKNPLHKKYGLRQVLLKKKKWQLYKLQEERGLVPTYLVKAKSYPFPFVNTWKQVLLK